MTRLNCDFLSSDRGRQAEGSAMQSRPSGAPHVRSGCRGRIACPRSRTARRPVAERPGSAAPSSGGFPAIPVSRRTSWLVCYDIADRRRLQRVYRVMCRHADPVQHSVFHAMATRPELLAIFDEIEERIDARHDDVRAYPLSAFEEPRMFGVGAFAPGIMLGYTRSLGFTLGRHPVYPESDRSNDPNRRKGRPKALIWTKK